jgi:hypothetical protein
MRCTVTAHLTLLSSDLNDRHLLYLQVRHLMFTWCLTNGIIDTLADLEVALAAAVCNAPPQSSLQRALGWAQPLLPLLGGVYLARNWAAVLGRALPAALRQGSEGEWGTKHLMICKHKLA